MSPSGAAAAAAIFDRRRLTQAREHKGLTKHDLAVKVGVSPAVIGQYEAGATNPSGDVLGRLALALGFSVDFFARGGDKSVSLTDAHFRSLRSTTRAQRRQAITQAIFAAEIAAALEEHIRLPALDLPHYELPPGAHGLAAIEALADQARVDLELGTGPIPHMVRLLESRGVVAVRLRAETERVSAFSCPFRPRPVVVLSTNRDDKARSRMDAAHELAHLLLHHEVDPGSQSMERQANAFAAAFLMPPDAIRPYLPVRLHWQRLVEAKQTWGVSLAALLYRSRTLGVISEAAYRRAIVSLGRHTWEDGTTWRRREPAPLGVPEEPALLHRAAELATTRGFTLEGLAERVRLPLTLVQETIGLEDEAPMVAVQQGPSSLRTVTPPRSELNEEGPCQPAVR
ncbi:MAG: XRE family transcriptional regulator [Acidimicrobiia bacterium]